MEHGPRKEELHFCVGDEKAADPGFIFTLSLNCEAFSIFFTFSQISQEI